MANPEGKGGFKKGCKGNPGGLTKEQRAARDELRAALAKDGARIHAALMRLVDNDNPAAVVYAHTALHGKEPMALDVEHSGSVENPAKPLTTEMLVDIANAAKAKT